MHWEESLKREIVGNKLNVKYKQLPCHQGNYPLGSYVLCRINGAKHKVIGYSRYGYTQLLCENENGYTYNNMQMLLDDIIGGQDMLDNGFDLDNDKVSFLDIRYDIKH